MSLPARVSVAANVDTPVPLPSITLRLTSQASPQSIAVLLPVNVDRLTVTPRDSPVWIPASPRPWNVERVTVADDERAARAGAPFRELVEIARPPVPPFCGRSVVSEPTGRCVEGHPDARRPRSPWGAS